MNNDQYLNRAKELACQAFNERYNAREPVPATTNEFYVVWFAKTLKNWKALISTDVKNGLYFEVTYNGEKCEAYVDTYNKIWNQKVSD